MIKLQSDFLGPYFVEDGCIIRPMGKNGLKLTAELSSARRKNENTYLVTDMNDDQEVWYPTMSEIVYLEARRFLKQPDFERFVAVACGAIACRHGASIYPRVQELFPNGYSEDLPHVVSNLNLCKVIERSYYRRLSKNHFEKAKALRDGEKSLYGISTDVITKQG